MTLVSLKNEICQYVFNEINMFKIQNITLLLQLLLSIALLVAVVNYTSRIKKIFDEKI